MHGTPMTGDTLSNPPKSRLLSHSLNSYEAHEDRTGVYSSH